MKKHIQNFNGSQAYLAFSLKLWSRASACILLGPLIISIPVIVSCGDNVAERYAPANDYEKAELDMERSQFSQASEKLETILTAEPNHHKARSLLAAAYAAQAGITTLGLIKGAAIASGTTGSPIKKFNLILPEASSGSLTLMDNACTSMALIPDADLTTEMSLQRSLFFSAYAFLQIKFFATNAEALANISANDAAKLIQTLANAASSSGNSALTTLAATVSTSIAAIPGDDITKVKVTLGVSTP